MDSLQYLEIILVISVYSVHLFMLKNILSGVEAQAFVLLKKLVAKLSFANEKNYQVVNIV